MLGVRTLAVLPGPQELAEAVGGLLQGGQAPDERGLTGAGPADDPMDGSSFDVQVHNVNIRPNDVAQDPGNAVILHAFRPLQKAVDLPSPFQ